VLVQQQLIRRVRELAAADERVVAVLMYGSFSQRQGDEHSDVEFYLYFEDGRLAAVDRRAWIEAVAPLVLWYRNEYGVDTAIFSSLVRGEFHFEAASAIVDVWGWDRAWFAGLDDAVVYDRTGALTDAVQPLVRSAPRLDEASEGAFLVASLLNWTLMGSSILARGDHARAYGFLQFIQSFALRAERLLANETRSWEEPRRRLAQDLPDAHRRYVQCTARLEPPALVAAYAATWSWSRELIDALAVRYGVDVAAPVVEHLDERFGGDTLGSRPPASAPPYRAPRNASRRPPS
jgi:lincosamide nucleotidyltransferase B/F